MGWFETRDKKLLVWWKNYLYPLLLSRSKVQACFLGTPFLLHRRLPRLENIRHLSNFGFRGKRVFVFFEGTLSSSKLPHKNKACGALYHLLTSIISNSYVYSVFICSIAWLLLLLMYPVCPFCSLEAQELSSLNHFLLIYQTDSSTFNFHPLRFLQCTPF